jgi:UDP-N-acetylmuramoylalanine--D-glutamate ligase
MLQAAGSTVHLAGNIGRAALDVLPEVKENDWVVLELSNFQLFDLQRSPHIGVCLMVVPEHLDWHPDAAEYYVAKTNLFAHQNSDDIAIYFPENENSKEIASHGDAKKIPYFTEPGAFVKDGHIVIDGQTICKTEELKLLGQHNWQNACAAATAVWQVTQDVEAIKSVLTSFTGLEHRLEFVRGYNGVDYYNDSFGTTPETAMVAIEAFSEPKVIILGGSDKGADYENLAKTVHDANVRAVLLIGETAPAINAALERNEVSNVVDGPKSMPAIVAAATELAQPGDVVLLSTGCASFDMFKNYKDRGDQFKKAVLELP